MRFALRAIQHSFCEQRRGERKFDWRYYFVAYSTMREGQSGIYTRDTPQLGFRVRMLNRCRVSSYYRDPFLSAVAQRADVGSRIGSQWFYGYDDERWLPFGRTSTALQCTQSGFAVRLSSAAASNTVTKLRSALAEYGVDLDKERIARVNIPQTEIAGRTVDTEDRILLGATLVQSLVDAGL